MRFWQGLTKAQRTILAALLALIIVNTLLWILFGRHTTVEYWNFRRCSWETPAGPKA